MRLFLTIITFIISAFSILSQGVYRSEILELLNLIIAFICSVALFSFQDRPYSLYKIFHIFILFFFCIAPMIQFKSGVQLLGTIFEEKDYIKTTVCVLIVLIFYNIVYIFYDDKIKVKKKEDTLMFNYKNLTLTQEYLFLFLSFSILFLFLFMNKFNLSSLIFRDGEHIDRVKISQITFLLTSYFMRPMAMVLFLIACIVGVKHRIVLWILGVFMLLAAPPTGMARFSAASIYLPIVVYFFPLLRKKNIFIFFFIFGLLVVFPLMDYFRVDNFRYDYSQFETMHFDSYSMFMRVLKDDIVTNGTQLLGVLLFWMPRSIWPDKPIGSGAYVAEVQDLWFANISMPYIGEGYINFGMIGVVAFVVILACITAYWDKKYWTITVIRKKDVQHVVYLMALGLFFFMLRGDLLSSFAYMCGFIFAFRFVSQLVAKNMIKE